MATTRAKFRCNVLTDYGTQQTVSMLPVVDGSPENQAFWAATPAGEVQLTISNPDAFAAFKAGSDYYVDFTPADDAGTGV